MAIGQKVRNASKYEELDYPFLIRMLEGYARPRDKITWLLKNDVLVRVKKGLYVFGPEYARGPYSVEVLANLIYGPSYISMQYALSFYGLIPERVEVVTSVTSKRDKEFRTPAGVFAYRYLHSDKYSVGVTNRAIDDERGIMIATPEKALADSIALTMRGPALSNEADVEAFVREDLRLDEEHVFDAGLMEEIASVYRNANVSAVFNWLGREKR